MNTQDFFKFVKKPIFIVLLLFLLVFATRLYVSFSAENFNYDAYYTLRQAEHIHDTGLPLYKDSFSYGGKTLLFPPLYYYVLAFFGLFMPLALVGKILPNLFAALIIIMVYYLALRISKNSKVSVIVSFMSGFIPVFFVDTNKISIDYFAILLMLIILYSIMRISERKYIDYGLIFMFTLVLATPLSFVLIFGLLLYLLLLKLENLPVEMKELELILFSAFLVFWVNLLIYKNAFLSHGLLVIWQNTPTSMLKSFFGNLTFIEVFWSISIVPLIFGVHAFYLAFHKENTKEVTLISAFGLGAFILLWFKLIDFVTGIMILSITLVILTAYSLKIIFDYVDKTKIYAYRNWIGVFIIILFVFTAIFTSIVLFGIPRAKITPTNNDILLLQWANNNLPTNATIISTLEEGDLVAYYAQRKNVLDKNFLLTPHIDQRVNDVNQVYTTVFETNAISLLTKYHSDYILYTSYAEKKYNIEKLSYVSDKNCFTIVGYLDTSKIYKNKCTVSI